MEKDNYQLGRLLALQFRWEQCLPSLGIVAGCIRWLRAKFTTWRSGSRPTNQAGDTRQTPAASQ